MGGGPDKTLSADTKAKALFDALVNRDARHWEPIIAQAIRQACNEKLEEAARVAENPGFIEATDTDWDLGVNFAKPFIAKAIRTLKETTP